jgi:hypothetical protein
MGKKPLRKVQDVRQPAAFRLAQPMKELRPLVRHSGEQAAIRPAPEILGSAVKSLLDNLMHPTSHDDGEDHDEPVQSAR